MNDFINALEQGDLEKIKPCPKADLHNHFVLGGSRRYLKELTGVEITSVKTPLSSMDEMHSWNRTNIGETFNGTEMRKLLIRAAFQQAKEDGVPLASSIGAVLMSPLIPMIF